MKIDIFYSDALNFIDEVMKNQKRFFVREYIPGIIISLYKNWGCCLLVLEALGVIAFCLIFFNASVTLSLSPNLQIFFCRPRCLDRRSLN